MHALRRFGRSIYLTARRVAAKNIPIFLFILLLLVLLFAAVDINLSSALCYYDYAGQFFDRTTDNYVAFTLNSGNSNKTSTTDGSFALWEELHEACGEEPLCAFGSGYGADGIEGVGYSPALFGIVPNMKEGRWLTEADTTDYGCVVCADLAEQYPIGSTFVENVVTGPCTSGGWPIEARAFRVVGILAEGERPLISNQQNGDLRLDTVVYTDISRPFVIFPLEYERYQAGFTMMFCTDRSAEEMQELLKHYGVVRSLPELVSGYQQYCLDSLLWNAPEMLFGLALSLFFTVCIMVMSFGRNRRYWSVLYLLGQSRRMLVGSICAFYTAFILLAWGLSRLRVWQVGVPSISVARLCTAGVVLLAILCTQLVVLTFFRRSPMELFTDNT